MVLKKAYAFSSSSLSVGGKAGSSSLACNASYSAHAFSSSTAMSFSLLRQFVALVFLTSVSDQRFLLESKDVSA